MAALKKRHITYRRVLEALGVAGGFKKCLGLPVVRINVLVFMYEGTKTLKRNRSKYINTHLVYQDCN